MGLMVRHTPAFGHPSPRGDGLTHHIDNQQLSTVRCRAIPSRRGVAEGRGVSHHQAHLNLGVSHHQPFHATNVPHHQSFHATNVPHHQTFRATNVSHHQPFNATNVSPPQTPFAPFSELRFRTAPTPFVVRSLSARCPVVVQSMTGQRLDNNWTTTGQRTKISL